jgi:hypothetical protein
MSIGKLVGIVGVVGVVGPLRLRLLRGHAGFGAGLALRHRHRLEERLLGNPEPNGDEGAARRRSSDHAVGGRNVHFVELAGAVGEKYMCHIGADRRVPRPGRRRGVSDCRQRLGVRIGETGTDVQGKVALLTFEWVRADGLGEQVPDGDGALGAGPGEVNRCA